MNLLELTGFITGIIGIWLTIRQNVWCFPVGLVNVTISLFLFLDQRLYSDAIQQVFYIVLLSYGWYNWGKHLTKKDLVVTWLTAKWRMLLSALAILLTLGMGTVFRLYTDASVPYADALGTSLSFIAQYLIAKKKIENWGIWIVVNLLYVGIYYNKELYLYMVLFSVYLVLAVHGWLTWKRELDKQRYATSGRER